MGSWVAGEVRTLPLESIGEQYRRYRLAVPEAEAAMVRSLQRYGQISPIVVCLREERPQLIDGFTRLVAARTVKTLTTLSARLFNADECTAKAAIYALNQVGRRPHELEEAWIVHALVREDGLSQLEAAQLLGRHKSWVCRRLALLEKLAEPVKDQLGVGLVSFSAARELTRLPAGNQSQVLTSVRRESLNNVELRGLVDLMLGSATREQAEFVLEKPREALRQAKGEVPAAWDPRLSSAGNRISKQLGWLLNQLGRMEQWLRHRGRVDLSTGDRSILKPSFTRLSGDARSVAELSDDLLSELNLR
jgi:ParB-like chromosome segregation protein Spo0J